MTAVLRRTGAAGTTRRPAARPGTRRVPVLPTAAVATVAAVVLAPLLALLGSALRPEVDAWAHLATTRLAGMVVATASLTLGVTAAATALGVGLAWLVTAYRFPGRRALRWVLALPLALPPYVTGFVWVQGLEPGGAGRRAWEALFGAGAWFPAVRSLPVAALVLVLALYPYVYLLAAVAFRDQAGPVLAAARTLGRGPVRAFWSVALPGAWPAIAAGAALVALEVLTDVGTVRLFNVQTVADGVFRLWFGLADREAATELAGALFLVAAAVLVLERRTGRRARSGRAGARPAEPLSPVRLRGPRAVLASVACGAVVALALVAPLVRLGGWAREAVAAGLTGSAAGGVGHHLRSSLVVTSVAVVACVVLGVVVALAGRWGRRSASALGVVTTAGYGLPGPVVALGVLVCLAAVDRSGILPGRVLLAGSFVGLVVALVVRYLALGVKPAEQAVAAVARTADDAARVLGARPAAVVRRVQLPLARGGVAVAAALVALDVVKELPATLLMRPFGIDTLPVWVWQAAGDARWVEAGIPSLLLVAVAAVPVALLVTLVFRGRSVSW